MVQKHLGWEIFQGSIHPWEATHPLYDGAEDSKTRSYYVTAASLPEIKVAIELWERENGMNVLDEVGVEEYYHDANQSFTDSELWLQKGNW
jgi:hypothetical protein